MKCLPVTRAYETNGESHVDGSYCTRDVTDLPILQERPQNCTRMPLESRKKPRDQKESNSKLKQTNLQLQE